LNLVTKKENLTKGFNPRYAQEINIAWNNICSYPQRAFPEVWKAICENNILQVNTITSNSLRKIQDIDKKIQSCKKFLEVTKSLIYGNSLRLPFSLEVPLQKLHSDLLILYCQKSDTAGFDNIAGQKRIISSSLPSFFITSLKYSSPGKYIKQEPARVTEKKYIVTRHQSSTSLFPKNKNSIDSSQSSQSRDTTFSSYINRQQPISSNFVGLKIKFDSEDSDSSCYSENSKLSIWKPVFKKKRAL